MTLLILFSLISTLIMTLFSYWFSLVMGVDYYIPSMIVKFVFPNKTGVFARLASWIIHLSIGIVFAVAWDITKHLIELKVTFITSLLYGIICGVIGIVGWKIIIALREDEIVFGEKYFLLHILLTHLVFGIVLLMLLAFYSFYFNDLLIAK